MSDEIRPFKINIPDSELDLLSQKLALARLPESTVDIEWAEDNGVTVPFMRRVVDHWRNGYSWRAEEARLNQMPQFTTTVTLPKFDPIELHFSHVKADGAAAPIPILFIHGWPGHFAEVQKALPQLTAAGFDVVAPSLMGYGWSSLPRQAGFNFLHQADVMHQLMLRLGYDRYVVQGGDWGAIVGRFVLMQYPEHAIAMHSNMPLVFSAPELKPGDLEKFTPFEQAAIKRRQWFQSGQQAYSKTHASKPQTMGFALHDSPVGMLAWMADKMNLWSDLSSLPGGSYTPDEYITWTLMHYFPGPTTAMQMYRANMEQLPGSLDPRQGQLMARNMVDNPVGVSHFVNEVLAVPREWFAKENNVVFWREHEKGGHFAAYERPKELADDVIEFFTEQWSSGQQQKL